MLSDHAAAPIRGGTASAGWARRLLPCLSVLALVSLSYVLGGAVTFFDLPTSGVLRKAFIGARAWYEKSQDPAQLVAGDPHPVVDDPARTYDGFTLCTYSPGKDVALINMRGDLVHEWTVPFSRVWANPPHLPGPIDDAKVGIYGNYLYPNGDLLAVFQGRGEPTYGYGLVKWDRDSNIVWRYAGNVHHDIDVGEDGTVYAIEQQLVYWMPEGLEYVPTPCLVDYLTLLSPAGVVLKRISILDALRDSPYRPLLSALERSAQPGGPADVPASPAADDTRRRDVLHMNCVRVLTRRLAPAFPLFRAGQVLISLRHLDTIAVVDTERGSVVWAARGPWRSQHDPMFLDNGHLLLFDNLGSPAESRVLEYDPQTQAFPWSYSGEGGVPFTTVDRGMSQRLPNGNTLIVNSWGGEILEVTQDKELVWYCPRHRFVASARRYGPGELHFLEGGTRARP